MITLIAAVARNGVIGQAGSIPWRVPGEQKAFRELTMGDTLVMGRATYDSIGRPLPGRTTIVLTRDPDWHVDGVVAVGSIEEALVRATGDVWIAGGAAVYELAMPHAHAQRITEIPLEPPGDTYFPAIDPREWQQVERVHHDDYDVVRWERHHAADPG